MEYSSNIWSPTLKKYKDALDKVQCRTVRWIRSDYRQWSSVTAMLTDLGLVTLEKRREDQKLSLMYKVIHRLVCVIWAELGLEKAGKSTWASHCHKLRHHQNTTTEYRHSFICSTIPEWNKLPASMAEDESVATFKGQLVRLADQARAPIGVILHLEACHYLLELEMWNMIKGFYAAMRSLINWPRPWQFDSELRVADNQANWITEICSAFE